LVDMMVDHDRKLAEREKLLLDRTEFAPARAA